MREVKPLAVDCPACGARNLVAQDALRRPHSCRSCRERLDLSPEAIQAAQELRQRREAFLRGEGLVGQAFGSFKVEQVLGQGGMGVVCRAQDLVLDRPVAVKLFPPVSHQAARQASDRLVREARLAARLDHPHVVRVYSVNELPDGQWMIVMELLRGGDLRRRLDPGGPLALADGVRWLRHVADALQAAHARHILHRDIKLQNLLLTETNDVKVADFGLASDLSDPSLRRRLAGTAPYMAPEVWRGEPPTDRVDVYALGVVAFELITGKAPFTSEATDDAQRRRDYHEQHVSAVPPSLRTQRPEVPGDLAALVARCLAKAPEERPTAAEALDALRHRSLLRRVRAPESLEDSGTDSGAFVHAGREVTPYATALGLKRFAFRPLRGGQGAYRFPALDQAVDRLVAALGQGASNAVVVGLARSGRGVLIRALVAATRFPLAVVRHEPESELPLVERLAQAMLHLADNPEQAESAEPSPSGSSVALGMAVSVGTAPTEGLRAGADRLARELRALALDVQLSLRRRGPILVELSGLDNPTPTELSDLRAIASAARGSPLRLLVKLSPQHVEAGVRHLTPSGRDGPVVVDAPPLARDDLQPYLAHQLAEAGSAVPAPTLTRAAQELLLARTGGVPGPLNALLHNALCVACQGEAATVRADHVLAAAAIDGLIRTRSDLSDLALSRVATFASAEVWDQLEPLAPDVHRYALAVPGAKPW